MENKGLLIGIAAVALIGIAVFAFGSNKGDTANTQQPVAQNQQATPVVMEGTSEMAQDDESVQMMDEGTYMDGTYAASGNYTSPAGQEAVDVQLTLKDGIVEDVTFTGKATNEKSIFMQSVFNENFAPLVIGKNIDEVKLDKVSGSSLTSGGFNEAIEAIKEDASS